jgi:hypothetical protein
LLSGLSLLGQTKANKKKKHVAEEQVKGGMAQCDQVPPGTMVKLSCYILAFKDTSSEDFHKGNYPK